MHKQTLHKAVGALLFCLATSFAFSQCTLINLSISDRANMATDIFEGKVLTKTYFWNSQQTEIYTAHLVEVYKVFKGKISVSQVEVVTPGGEIGLEIQIHTPNLYLSPGDIGIFFAKPTDATESPNLLPWENKLESVSNASGFVKYDLKKGMAFDNLRN